MYHLAPDIDPLVTIEQYVPATNTRTLVEQAQAGNTDAFGQLYSHYYGFIYRTIARRVTNRQLVEDFTSDVFARAFRSINQFTWRGPDPGQWLATIAHNLITNYYESHRHRFEVNTGEIRVARSTADTTPENNPETAAINNYTNITVLAAVQRLKPDQRQCIMLRFLHGFSFAEIATRMGKTEGAVRGIQHRAMRVLARLIPRD